MDQELALFQAEIAALHDDTTLEVSTLSTDVTVAKVEEIES